MNPGDDPAATEEARLDAAWDLLESGDAQAALARVQGLDAASRERNVLEAAVQLELDDLPAAEEALQRARRCPGVQPDQDADIAWTSAEIALRKWDIGAARALFERTASLERTTAVIGRLALCAEMAGEFELADGLLAEAERIDPEGWLMPPRLSEQEFEQVVDEAISGLPAEFRDVLEETQILVEPMPQRELIDPADTAQTPPDMLGLFVGTSLLERMHDQPLALPSAIHLFQRNLERASRDRADLIEEIKITLYHEIGHMLGFDEEGVERMGLE
jgi:predicted Zn-dependent protease with MMP-like domain